MLCACELCVLNNFSIQKVLQMFFFIIYTHEFQIPRNIRCTMLMYTDDDRVHLNERPSVRPQSRSFCLQEFNRVSCKDRSVQSLNRVLWRLNENETISSWTLNNTVNQSVVHVLFLVYILILFWGKIIHRKKVAE